MQKIVIDTNVIVSGLIQRSYPYLILNELFLQDTIKICLSEELVLEYYEVLHRPKFSRYNDFLLRAESMLAQIQNKGKRYYPSEKLKIIKDDDDNMLLELAEECKADFIITGNTNDFQISSYKETQIITPKEYWERFWAK
jgi:hypothetical protein